MTKKIAVLLLCALLIAALSSCGANYNFDISKYITLPSYKGVEISAAEVDTQLQSNIDKLISDATTTEEVSGRAVRLGDIANIDYTGYQDGVAFDNGSGTGFDLEIGSGTFIDGFEDAIVGHEIGDTFDAELKFPDDYQNNPDLAGQSVTFTITVNKISTKVVPEWTDAFVAEKTDYTTIDEYKTETIKDLRKTLAWNKVVNGTTVIAYPKKNVKEYYNNMVKNYKTYAANYGTTLDNFVASYAQQSMDDFLADVVSYAKQQVLNEMIMHSIANAEKIEVTKAEYDARVGDFLAQSSYESVKEMEKAYTKSAIEQSMLLQMVVEYVEANAVDVD